MGNFYPHKNVTTLIKAFKEIPHEYDLVLSGPQDFFASKMLTLINELGLENRVHMHHSPGKENLKYLYSHAEALIHPSFSEGFGLPLVEAMAVNLPIIASDIPVFNELLPANTPMFNPHSALDIARTVQNYLKSPNKPVYSDVMGRYSFENMAEKTLELYKSLF